MAKTALFDEYFKQIRDLQQKAFKTVAKSSSETGIKDKVSGSFETALNLQKEWLKAALKAQETGVNAVLSTQQELCNNYFKLLRNNPYIK